MKNNHLKQHIGYWLNRARMNVHQTFEERLAKHDISVAQWCILISMYDKQATSVKELSDYIEVDKASISRVIDRLVQKGLMNHSMGKDRRSGFLQLTEIGLNLVPQLIQEAEQNELFFFKDLTEENKIQLVQVLKTISMVTTKVLG